jgi:hypothetical protein
MRQLYRKRAAADIRLAEGCATINIDLTELRSRVQRGAK